MDLTTIYCNVDDFVAQYSDDKKELLNKNCSKRGRKSSLSKSEIITILIVFHQSSYRNFKAFYREYVCKHLYNYFPGLVSYNRFVELQSSVLELLSAYLVHRFDNVTGISFIDSTPIQVCKPKRMSRNKVFKDSGKKGKSTIGWFFGLNITRFARTFSLYSIRLLSN